MSLRCLSCQRFVSSAKCNHHIERGDYGTVHSVEYECERCAEARPYDQPPRSASPRQRFSTKEDNSGKD